jgi:hypothetical protein
MYIDVFILKLTLKVFFKPLYVRQYFNFFFITEDVRQYLNLWTGVFLNWGGNICMGVFKNQTGVPLM